MTIPFSLYAPRESGLHKLHPLTKLALAGFVALCALVLPRAASYLLFLLLIVPLALWGRVFGRLMSAALRVALPFAISLLIIQGLFWQTGPILARVGPISIKLDGILFAVSTIGRILAILSSFVLLSLTTRPDALMLALSQRGLPDVIAYIILTTLQIIPRFQSKAQTIIDAQRSRGLETEGGLLHRIRALLPLVVPLVLSSIVDIEERAIALEARAFSHPGTKTSLFDLSDSLPERIFRWSLLAIALIIVVVRILTLRSA